jgi:excisionase family DNA binding protein
MQPLLTAHDVSRLASVPRRRVYQCARTGTLPSVRIGRLRRFRATDVEAWLAKDAHRSARRLRRFRANGSVSELSPDERLHGSSARR